VSAENSELVRSALPMPDVDVAARLTDDEAADRWIDEVERFYDPSFQGTIRLPGVAPVTVLGLDGLRNVMRGWLSHWVSYEVEIEDVIENGAFVVMVFRANARRHPDAPEEERRRTVLWELRDGRIVRGDFNIPHAEALAMAGLKP
jgi:SnoaL-like domain